jgi:hypothetical protein
MWEVPRWLVLVKNQRQTQPIGHLEPFYQISFRRTLCVQNRPLLVRNVDIPCGSGQTGIVNIRAALYRPLRLALAVAITAACSAQTVVPPATSAAPTALSPTATLARPSPTPTAVPTAVPTSSPSPSAAPVLTTCPVLTGGNTSAQAQLVAVRAAHNPGFDRVVFELGPTSVGPYALPPYQINATSGFVGTSGKQVPVDGNAFLSVRFRNASTVDPNTGQQTFTQTDIHPGLPLVRDVKLIDDFERVMTWGLGLERLACPMITELAGPVRLVVDLPTPP